MTLIPPPLLAVAAALAQKALSRDAPPSGPLRKAVAGTLAAGSVALAAGSARRFRQSGTTVEPFHPERTAVLVTTGANALTRNPMYVGMAGVLLANALRRRSWAALLPLAAFVGVMDRSQIAAEESALSAKFGREYDAYRAAVPRWVDARSVTARS